MRRSIHPRPARDKAAGLDRAACARYNDGMSKLNEDGNILGRIGAVALLAAAGFGLHRLNCASGEMCAVMKTDSCCSGETKTSAPAPAPAK